MLGLLAGRWNETKRLYEVRIITACELYYLLIYVPFINNPRKSCPKPLL